MSLTETGYPGDVIKWLCARGYCLETRVIEGLAGSAVASYVGEVMKAGTGVKLVHVTSNSGASAIAVLLEPVTAVENYSDCNRLCLVRGPALADHTKFVFSTSNTQAAAAKAALKALGIVDAGASATWTTQST